MSKILVIEDAEPLRNDIIEMLSFEGFDVIGAENGLVGVDAARTHKPDLIICDIMMPGLDGYGVLDALRKDDQMVSIPFIFLTAKTDRTDVRYGMGLGADDYLPKPFVASELLETIHARLNKRNTFDELAQKKVKELSDNIITALPHELRTPLNTILGFSDMLTSEAEHLSAEQVVDWSRHIHTAAQRLYRLFENYLLYIHAEVASRNPAEQEALRSKSVDQPSVIVQSYALNKAQQLGRKADLKMNVETNAVIHITDQHLGKIVEELIDNALKFSNPDSPVEVKTAIEQDYFEIHIKDKGRGMTVEQVEAVGAYMQFERWFYEQQGSGFGLALVKRLIEMYEGALTFDLQEPVGTSVIVKLKVVKP